MNPAPTAPPESFSIPQLAKRYGVSQNKILGWIEAGELRALNVATRATGERPRWRITAEALAEFEARRSSKPVEKPTSRRRPRPDYPRYV